MHMVLQARAPPRAEARGQVLSGGLAMPGDHRRAAQHLGRDDRPEPRLTGLLTLSPRKRAFENDPTCAIAHETAGPPERHRLERSSAAHLFPDVCAPINLGRVEKMTGTTQSCLSADWAAKRDRPQARDHSLSSVARPWFEALPVPLRPHRLCRLYPRVANLLALCWPDPALSGHLFHGLLIDKRGGRKGFPPEVAAELVRLRDYATELARLRDALALAVADDDKWAPHLMSPNDR